MANELKTGKYAESNHLADTRTALLSRTNCTYEKVCEKLWKCERRNIRDAPSETTKCRGAVINYWYNIPPCVNEPLRPHPRKQYLHRDNDLFAVVKTDRDQYLKWYTDGQLNREGYPAVLNFIDDTRQTTAQYWCDGLLHSFGGMPSYCKVCNMYQWHCDGLLHNENGQSVVAVGHNIIALASWRRSARKDLCEARRERAHILLVCTRASVARQ